MALPYTSLLGDDGTVPAGAIRAMVRNPGAMTATPLPVPVSRVQPNLAALLRPQQAAPMDIQPDWRPDWQSAPTTSDYINSGLATIGRLAAPKDESSKTLSDAVQDLIKRNQDFYASLGKLNSGASDSVVPPSDMASYLKGARLIESGNNDDAVNPESGATGRYQFLLSTAKSLMPDLDPAELKSPKIQEELMRRYTGKSVELLTPLLGRKPTAAELYTLHLLGHHGGLQLLANPDAPLTDTVDKAALVANKALFNPYKTGRDFLAGLNARFWG